jgi:CO/xanthine dehydrogenase Mo-binding subunit
MVDIGQGNRTALSLQVAEELRVPLAMVDLVMGDTHLSPFHIGTFGSRSMPDAGEDLRAAAASASETLVGLVAERFGMSSSELVASDAAVREGAPCAPVTRTGAGNPTCGNHCRLKRLTGDRRERRHLQDARVKQCSKDDERYGDASATRWRRARRAAPIISARFSQFAPKSSARKPAVAR